MRSYIRGRLSSGQASLIIIVIETRSCYILHTRFKLTNLLTWSSECWDHKCMPSYQGSVCIPLESCGLTVDLSLYPVTQSAWGSDPSTNTLPKIALAYSWIHEFIMSLLAHQICLLVFFFFTLLNIKYQPASLVYLLCIRLYLCQLWGQRDKSLFSSRSLLLWVREHRRASKQTKIQVMNSTLVVESFRNHIQHHHQQQQQHVCEKASFRSHNKNTCQEMSGRWLVHSKLIGQRTVSWELL